MNSRERILTTLKGGGYIFLSDHSVSWDNYCYAMELVEKYGKY